MNGKTHQLIGATTSIVASTVAIQLGLVELTVCVTMVAGSCLGSYIPDMDHPGSTLGKKIAIISHPINLLSRMFLAIHGKTKGKISLWFGELFAHRGLFHSPLFWIAIMATMFLCVLPLLTVPLVYQLVAGILVGLSIGIGMHLIADMFNPTGIPLLIPFSMRKTSIGKIVTGSRKEWGVIAICSIILVADMAFIIFLK